MFITYLSLGSNLGDRRALIKKQSANLIYLRVALLKSKIHETKPVGKTDQPMFLNCCIEIETDLSPLKLLSACQKSKNNLCLKSEKGLGLRVQLILIFYFTETRF